jgi:FtsP/CotA-like multicopper oxidase with cupredoxin domain
MIGAHYMFEDGATDQAKIGTFDDFYLINNLWEDHPIHIHLVNHQAIRAYSLKRLPENDNCTLYSLDFFRGALPETANYSDLELCNYIWDMPDETVV